MQNCLCLIITGMAYSDVPCTDLKSQLSKKVLAKLSCYRLSTNTLLCS